MHNLIRSSQVNLNTPQSSTFKGNSKQTAPKAKYKPVTRARKSKNAVGDPTGSDIREALKKLEGAATDSKRRDAADQPIQTTDSKATPSVQEPYSYNSYEEATAACDDHTVSPPSSPSKRTTKTDDCGAVLVKKRGRHTKTTRKDLLQVFHGQGPPGKVYDFVPYGGTPEKDKCRETSARKRLVLQRKCSSASESEGRKHLYLSSKAIRWVFVTNLFPLLLT